MAKSSELLRDLTHTAWLESEQMPLLPRGSFDPKRNPINPENPNYNPATATPPTIK